MAEITIRSDITFTMVAPRTSDIRRLLTVRRAGSRIAEDRFDPRSGVSRRSFVAELWGLLPDIPDQEFEQAILDVADAADAEMIAASAAQPNVQTSVSSNVVVGDPASYDMRQEVNRSDLANGRRFAGMHCDWVR